MRLRVTPRTDNALCFALSATHGDESSRTAATDEQECGRWLNSDLVLSPTLAYVGSLAGLDPVTPSTVYAASYSGLFKSTDGGDTFNLINSTLGASAYVSAMVIDPIHPNRLYAATINGQGVLQAETRA